MITTTNDRGERIDLITGQLVDEAGQPSSAPPAAAPTDPRKAGGMERGSNLYDKVNQLTWGMQSALFALPDAVTRKIGQGMNLDENEVFQFTRLFNKTLPEKIGGTTERAPVNAPERYMRAIGEGAGMSLPLTGVLGYFAAARPAAAVTAVKDMRGKLFPDTPGATLLSGIAKDAVTFVQKNPRLAPFLDVAFGSANETIRQIVEENMDDSNPNKAAWKDIIPLAAFAGVPAVGALASKFPSVKAANWVKGQLDVSTIQDMDDAVSKDLPAIWKLPVFNIAPGIFRYKAEQKLKNVFGPIADNEEAKLALKLLDDFEKSPNITGQGMFKFNAAESTMDPTMIARGQEGLERSSGKYLNEYLTRRNNNEIAYANLFDTLSPASRKPLQEAFREVQTEYQNLFTNLLKSQNDMTADEIASVSLRLGPENVGNLGDEIRGAIMGRMEMSAAGRKQALMDMGLTRAYSPEGLPMSTREGGRGTGASLFPSSNMESEALRILKKYQPSRGSGPTAVPEPIRKLNAFVVAQQNIRNKAEKNALRSLLDETVNSQFEKGPPGLLAAPDITKNIKESIDELMAYTVAGAKKKKSLFADWGGTPYADAEGNWTVPSGFSNFKLFINPNKLRADARMIAEKEGSIDINMPEALDYLKSAQEFRNTAILRYNSALKRGGETLAQRQIDTSNEVYKDIESLVLSAPYTSQSRSSGPTTGSFRDQKLGGMEDILKQYRDQFEQSLPLLISQKRVAGGPYTLPNEDVLTRSFSNARSLEQLQASLGQAPEVEGLLERGAIDWLRGKGVVNKEGLVDAQKIRQVLDKNQSIVEALPARVQQKLQDEVQLADDYVARLGQLDQRRVAATDDALQSMLKQAARPDADPRPTLAKALEDPASMRVLVNAFSKEPENLAALRRSVFDLAKEGSLSGGALQSFMGKNKNSLKILFDADHLKRLETLSDIQRRVYAMGQITGKTVEFEALDEQLKRLMGSGLGVLSTTLRSTAEGRLSPTTAAIAFLIRLTGSLETGMYDRVMKHALENPDFAKAIANLNNPAEAKKAVVAMQNIGVPINRFLTTAINRGAMDVGTDQEQQAQPQAPSAPPPPRRPLPPAPPTTGITITTRMPVAQPRPPASAASQLQMMYPSMFPNDPISALLKQRQAQAQPPAQ